MTHRLIICLLLSVLSYWSFSQERPSIPKSTKTEIINGKKYYLHQVEKGQTLYSIAKTYDVTVNTLLQENPEIIDALPIGKSIKIPVNDSKQAEHKGSPEIPSSVPKQNTVPPNNIYLHLVEKKETLYSLSKKFNVSVDDIIKLNPDAKDGVKAGQTLQIPVMAGAKIPVVKDKDKPRKTEMQTVLPLEAPPAAPKVVPIAPALNQDTSKKIHNNFNIACLFPFYTDMNTEEKEYKNIYDQRTIYPKSEIAVELYEGFLLAVDSLKKQGLSLNIFTYDTYNDSLSVEEILKKPEMKEMNLIIGPLTNTSTDQILGFGKKNHIPVVVPFSQNSKLLLGNPFVCKATPSILTQVEQEGDYILSQHRSDNIILIHNENAKERPFIDAFKVKLKILTTAKDSVKEVNYKKSTFKGIQDVMSLTKKNVIVCPSNDQAFVTELINKLNGIRNAYSTCLFGLEQWMNYDNLDFEYLQHLNVHYPASIHVDYEDPSVKSMIKRFREKYATDPSKYAMHGYDIGMFFLGSMQTDGSVFLNRLSDKKHKGVQTGFSFERTAIESGYENTFIHMLKYVDSRVSR